MKQIPDEATSDDIEYRRYVLDEIRRGAREIERGDVIQHEEAKRRLAKWLDK